MFAPRRIVAAMADLDPESRALIELSARRGMSEDELAELLRLDPTELRRRRERAIEEFGAALGLTGPRDLEELRHELGRLDAEQWAGREPEPEKKPRRGIWRAVAIGTVLVAVGAGVAVIIAAQGDDDEAPAPPVSRPSSPSPPAKQPAPAVSKAGPVVTLQRLNDTHARGTVRLIRRGDSARLRLRAHSFLRPKGGGYAAWLYNSPTDARLLAATRRTSFNRDLRLPGDYTRYRFVDVSREPSDDPSHGGLSLLRAPLKALEP